MDCPTYVLLCFYQLNPPQLAVVVTVKRDLNFLNKFLQRKAKQKFRFHRKTPATFKRKCLTFQIANKAKKPNLIFHDWLPAMNVNISNYQLQSLTKFNKFFTDYLLEIKIHLCFNVLRSSTMLTVELLNNKSRLRRE